jgi:hypothetical protein
MFPVDKNCQIEIRVHLVLLYKVFQNGIVGCLDRKKLFATFRRLGPALHYTYHDLQAAGKCEISFLSFMPVVNIQKLQESEMMPRVYPTKTSKNMLLF